MPEHPSEIATRILNRNRWAVRGQDADAVAKAYLDLLATVGESA